MAPRPALNPGAPRAVSPSMRPLARILLASVLAAGLLAVAPAAAGVGVGDRAAEFVKVVDADGKQVRLRDFKDRIVVLTFGASWCAPCKKELPALEKLARSYDPKKVVFVAVNIDSSVAKGKKFVRQVGLSTVRSFFDPKHSTVESWDPPKMPSTFVIERGIVKGVHAGYAAGDEKAIARLIDRALE